MKSLGQKKCHYSTLAMELCLFCNKLSQWISTWPTWWRVVVLDYWKKYIYGPTGKFTKIPKISLQSLFFCNFLISLQSLFFCNFLNYFTMGFSIHIGSQWVCRSFTHCGLVTPYDDMELGQHWLRYWLVAWWHQAITRTNVDWASVKSSDIHIRAIL